MNQQSSGLSFEKLPSLSRAFIILAGPVVTIVIGMTLLSLAQTLPDSLMVTSGDAGASKIIPSAIPDLSVHPQSATTESQVRLLFHTVFTYFWLIISMQSLSGWGGLVGFLATCGGTGGVSTGAWFSFLGVVIVGMGILNLLPFPMFIGGQLLLLLWEARFGRVQERTRTALALVGFIIHIVVLARVVQADLLWINT